MTSVDPLLLVDPQSYARHGYPHEAWAKLRNEATIHRFEPAGWPPFWALTRHEHIVEVSKQPTIFLNAPGMMFEPQRNDAEQTEFQSAGAQAVSQGGVPLLYASRSEWVD